MQSGVQSIGVIGGGILGNAIARGFLEHAEVKVFDIVKEKSTHSLEEAATCEIVFIALPTPANPNGSCNTFEIEQFLLRAEHLGWWKPESCFILRSTVPIGFTQAQAANRGFVLPLLHSPEFLTARVALTDFQVPARNIIGKPQVPAEPNGNPADPIMIATQCSAALMLGELYMKRFPGIKIHLMPSNASELVKLACNTFFGAKVQLFNLFSEIAKAAGVEWEDVRAGIMSDGRISHSHTAVPGNDGIVGAGGQCIPKDSASLYTSGTALGVDCEIIREVLERNDRIRREFDPGLTRIELAGRWADIDRTDYKRS